MTKIDSKERFARRLHDGYTQVARGSGQWTDESTRIYTIWAFYHPTSPTIATIEIYKVNVHSHTIRGPTTESLYSAEEFEQLSQKNRLRMGEKRNLTEILAKWEE